MHLIRHMRRMPYESPAAPMSNNATDPVEPQGAHTMCLCSRLLLYSKCTGFTVCFTYSDVSLTMYINQ